MKTNRQKTLEAIFYFLIFAFFYVWFAKIHPLVVYDGDDWTYLAYVRKTTPIWGDWNPAKVFPEVIMPFLSNIFLHTLVPLTGDYITGFTVGHALVVSGFITAYVWCFTGLVKRIFGHSRLTASLIGILFLVLHFLVFRTEPYENSYLFFCEDLNCYYNYLIPALLNASLVMFMLENADFENFLLNGNPALKGMFYSILYLAVFSNLVVSGILAAFAGSQLLLRLLRQLKTFRLKNYVSENFVYLLILGMWFVSAIFELSGGRASAAGTASLLTKTHYALILLKKVLLACNKTFWATVIIVVVLCVFFLLRNKGKVSASREFLPGALICLVAGAAIVVYACLICGMVNYYTMNRSEYQFSMFFYGFLIVGVALAYVAKQQPKLLTVLPLVLLFLVGEINTNGKTFKDSLMSDYAPSVCADISRDILNQYLQADEAGLTETVIYVPMHVADPVNDDNWPHSLVLLSRIGRALYEQGIISRPINATFSADPAMNERYHIPVPSK